MISRKNRIRKANVLKTCGLMLFVLCFFTDGLRAEERKFAVMLATSPKAFAQAGNDGSPPGGLMNVEIIRKDYFDDINPALDSFAEYWEEISYGDVTVSGDVFEWVTLPWAIEPNGPNGGGRNSPADYIDLFSFDSGTCTNAPGGVPALFSYGAGEVYCDCIAGGDITPDVTRDKCGALVIIDLVGEPRNPQEAPERGPGLIDSDAVGINVWTPGERFLDVDADDRWDGIDEKNDMMCHGPEGCRDICSAMICEPVCVGGPNNDKLCNPAPGRDDCPAGGACQTKYCSTEADCPSGVACKRGSLINDRSCNDDDDCMNLGVNPPVQETCGDRGRCGRSVCADGSDYCFENGDCPPNIACTVGSLSGAAPCDPTDFFGGCPAPEVCIRPGPRGCDRPGCGDLFMPCINFNEFENDNECSNPTGLDTTTDSGCTPPNFLPCEMDSDCPGSVSGRCRIIESFGEDVGICDPAIPLICSSNDQCGNLACDRTAGFCDLDKLCIVPEPDVDIDLPDCCAEDLDIDPLAACAADDGIILCSRYPGDPNCTHVPEGVSCGTPRLCCEFDDVDESRSLSVVEPFEDHLVRWEPQGATPGSTWVRVDREYIKNNYPGDVPALLARTGNGYYDPPDIFFDHLDGSGNPEGTKMMQDAGFNQHTWSIPKPGSFAPYVIQADEPTWFDSWWSQRYGSTAPAWPGGDLPGSRNGVRMRAFDPAAPNPPVVGSTEDRRWFASNAGGWNGLGRGTEDDHLIRFDVGGNEWDDDILPEEEFGYYDGWVEHDDLASSRYHRAGDKRLGEVTSPINDRVLGGLPAIFGDDLGPHDPEALSPDGDSRCVAAGPHAINIHGEKGYDAGDVCLVEWLTWRRDGTSPTVTSDWQTENGRYHPFATPSSFSNNYRPSGRCTDSDPTDGKDATRVACLASSDCPSGETCDRPTTGIGFRDYNLDGMIDQGEVRPELSANYVVDSNPFTANDGTHSLYPYNRSRLTEDVVEALDPSIDWDNFVDSNVRPGQFTVSGIVLLPIGSYTGDPFPNASSLSWDIYTEDTTFDPKFHDLVICQDCRDFPSAVAYAAHEYLHSWEGYPDLYDYDVFDTGGTNIINCPMGFWDIMERHAEGLVHPSPPLKEVFSQWIEPVNIKTALTPGVETTLVLRQAELDRDGTYFYLENDVVIRPMFASDPQGANLGTVDLATGLFTVIGPFTGALGNVTELEWDPTGTTLYATTGGGNAVIHTVHPATGTILRTVGHAAGALNGLEFDAEGDLLGTHIPSPGNPSELVRVDPETGVIVSIGATGFGNIGGLAFDRGFTTLYGITSGSGAVPPTLLNVNPTTGAAVAIATVPLPVEMSSLEFTTGGQLVAGGDDGILYEINPTTGLATALGALVNAVKVSGLSVNEGASGGERYYFWAAGSGTDSIFPGRAMLMMKTNDFRANTEALALQQRTDPFNYRIIQADGLNDLLVCENPEGNTGDFGDMWPGSSNTTKFNFNTNPSAIWQDARWTGLDITNVVVDSNGTVELTLRWEPTNIPSLKFTDPPGGGSVGTVYRIQYETTDVYGRTDINLYYTQSNAGIPDPNTATQIIAAQIAVCDGGPQDGDLCNPANGDDDCSVCDGGSHDGDPCNPANGNADCSPGGICDATGICDAGRRKGLPGTVSLTTFWDASGLADGLYYLFAKLTPDTSVPPAPEGPEIRFTAPLANRNNFGDGEIMDVILSDQSRLETWIVQLDDPINQKWVVSSTMTQPLPPSPAEPGPEFFATTGVPYDSKDSVLRFHIVQGTIPFELGDTFSFKTTGITNFSASLRVLDGHVVTGPDAVIDAAVDGAPGAPLSGQVGLIVNFDARGSSDPEGLPLTYDWNFGDGTGDVGIQVSHTFDRSPTEGDVFTVTLRATNTVPQTGIATVDVTVLNNSPSAVISANKTSGPAPLDVHFDAAGSSDIETLDADLIYQWDFGDGVAENPSGDPGLLFQTRDHRYTSDESGSPCTSAAPCQLTATLTVTDSGGASSTASIQISVGNSSPVAVVSVDKTGSDSPLTVTFDATASTDVDGDPIQVFWDFDDGTNPAEGLVVQNIYNAPQDETKIYRPTAQLFDGRGGETTWIGASIIVRGPVTPSSIPKASFDFDPEPPFEVGKEFTVTSTSEDQPDAATLLIHKWDFGDGTTPVEGLDLKEVTHTYSTSSEFGFTVKLIVTDDEIPPNSKLVSELAVVNDDTDGGPVEDENKPPTAVFIVNTSGDPVAAGSPVQFDASGSTDPEGAVLHYRWDFGDGSRAEAGFGNSFVLITHTYAEPGVYSVLLTVSDDLNASADVVHQITVRSSTAGNQPPVAILVDGPRVGAAPFTVELNGLLSFDPENDPLTFIWEFSDENGVIEIIQGDGFITRTFETEGVYLVVMKVDDGERADDEELPSETAEIRVTSPVVLPDPTDPGQDIPDDEPPAGSHTQRPPSSMPCGFGMLMGLFVSLLGLSVMRLHRRRRGFLRS